MYPLLKIWTILLVSKKVSINRSQLELGVPTLDFVDFVE